MYFCWTLSCAVMSSEKNLWRRASAFSSTDVVTYPSERVSDISTGCLAKPALQVLYIFQGVFYCTPCKISSRILVWL